jgi:hypothetical protein
VPALRPMISDGLATIDQQFQAAQYVERASAAL